MGEIKPTEQQQSEVVEAPQPQAEQNLAEPVVVVPAAPDSTEESPKSVTKPLELSVEVVNYPGMTSPSRLAMMLQHSSTTSTPAQLTKAAAEKQCNSIVLLLDDDEISSEGLLLLRNLCDQSELQLLTYLVPKDGGCMRLPDSVFDTIVVNILERMREGRRVCLYSGTDRALRSCIFAACTLIKENSQADTQRMIDCVQKALPSGDMMHLGHLTMIATFATRQRYATAPNSPAASMQYASGRITPMTDVIPRTFLVGMDGSDMSQRAFQNLRILLRPQDRVILACVDTGKQRVQRIAPTRTVEHYIQQCYDLGVKAEEVTVKGKDAGRELCKIAADYHADVLIIGYSRLKDVKSGCMSAPRPRMGTTCKYVMLNAPCSFLMAK